MRLSMRSHPSSSNSERLLRTTPMERISKVMRHIFAARGDFSLEALP